MASALQSSDFVDNNKVLTIDFDPNVTTAVDVGWQDMMDYGELTVVFTRTIGTGVLTEFKILSNTASDGSGTDTEVKVHAIAAEPNAIADHVVLSCRSDELGANRYVSAQARFATGTDEAMVVYIFSKPRHATQSLTADTIA